MDLFDQIAGKKGYKKKKRSNHYGTELGRGMLE